MIKTPVRSGSTASLGQNHEATVGACLANELGPRPRPEIRLQASSHSNLVAEQGWLRRAGWLLLLLCMSPLASALTLEQAFDAALRHEPEFQAAIHDRRAAGEFKVLGRANLLPTLAYSYSWGKNWSEVEQDSLFGPVTEERDYRSYSSSLRLEQPLFDYSAWVARDIGRLRAARAELEFEARLQELVVKVSRAYTDTLVAWSRRRWAREQTSVLKALLERNEALRKAGEGTLTEVLETRSRLALARAERLAAEEQAKVAERRLTQLTGVDLSGWQPRTQDAVSPLPLDGDLARWREQALRHSPVLAVRREDVALAEREVDRQKAGHWPTVSLYASTRRTDSDSENTYGQHYDTDSVGVQVQVPLYAGGGVAAARRQAAARRDAEQQRLLSARQQLLLAVEQRFRDCRGGASRLEALAEAVTSAEQLVEATRQSLRGGERNNQDLLEARRQLHEARLEWLGAGYDYLNAWLELHQQSGVLGVRELKTVDGALSFSPSHSS